MFTKKLRAILVPTFLLFLLSAALVLFLDTLLKKPAVQNFLLDEMAKATGYKLHVGKLEVDLWGGIGISAHELKAESRDGCEKISVPRLRITFGMQDLLKGQIIPSGIFLSQPKIELALGEWTRPLKAKEGFELRGEGMPALSGFQTIYMNQARVHIKDYPFNLKDLEIDAYQENKVPFGLRLSLKGKVAHRKENVPFSLHGTIIQNAKTQRGPFADLLLKMHGIPLNWLPTLKSMPEIDGHAEAHLKIKGHPLASISCEGKTISEGVRFQIATHGRKKDYSFERLEADFNATYSNRSLNISMLRVDAPDLQLSANSKLDFKNQTDPFVSIRVKSPFLSLMSFKKIFPTPLVPSWIEDRIFPLITGREGGNVCLENFTLNWPFNQKRMDRTINEKPIYLKLKLKNLEVLKDGGAFPFTGVSGELDFEKGSFVVSGVKARFGKSMIDDFSLDIGIGDEHASEYKVSVAGVFDLKELKQTGEMDIIPEGVRRQFEKFTSLSGAMEGKVDLIYQEGLKYPEITKGKYRFKDCHVVHRHLYLPLIIDQADLYIDREKQSMFSATGKWGKTEFYATGSAAGLYETGKADIVARADVGEIASIFSSEDPFPLKFNDLVNCRIALSWVKDLWSYNGQVDLEGVVLETASYHIDLPGENDRLIFSGNFLPSGIVNLKSLKCLIGQSAIKLTGTCDLHNRDRISVTLSSDRLLLEDFGIQLKEMNVSAKGILRFQMAAQDFIRNPSGSLEGELEAQDLSIFLSRFPSQVSDCNFKIKFSGKESLIQKFNMRMGQSSLSLNGHFQGWDGLKGSLFIDAGYLDLSDIIAEETASDFKIERSDPGRFIKRTEIEMEMNVLEGQWKKLKFGPCKSELLFRSGNFHITGFGLQLEHGSLEAKGYVKRGTAPEIAVSTSFHMVNQPVQEMLQSVYPEKDRLEGSLTINGELSMKGNSGDAIISSLSGGVNACLEKGNIKTSAVIFKILDFLSIQKFFERRPPGFSKKDFYFQNIKGDFTVKKGLLETRNCFVKSPAFNAAARGTVDFVKKWTDLEVGVQPLGTIDYLVNKIPIAGYILTGDKKTLLIYYFKVEGPVTGPEVKYVPLKNWGHSTIDFFKRLYLTPERLLKKISGIPPDSVKDEAPLPEAMFLHHREFAE